MIGQSHHPKPIKLAILSLLLSSLPSFTSAVSLEAKNGVSNKLSQQLTSKIQELVSLDALTDLKLEQQLNADAKESLDLTTDLEKKKKNKKHKEDLAESSLTQIQSNDSAAPSENEQEMQQAIMQTVQQAGGSS
jgi:hypothetical protein